jgi:protein gp37
MKADPKRIEKGMYWDRALSIVEGCSPVSPGCDNCWSAKATETRSHQNNPKIKARYAGLTHEGGEWSGRVRLMHNDLEKPARVRKPTVWAVWNDLFHPKVMECLKPSLCNPESFLDQAFLMMRHCWQSTFLILTKRPENMLRFYHSFYAKHPGYWSSNIWLGITAENQQQYDDRWEIASQIPITNLFVSGEPLLGPIDFSKHKKLPRWFVVGGESGSKARPMHPDWARSLRDQCQDACVPFFFKQWGSWYPFYDRGKDDPDWRKIPRESKNICRINLEGGIGFHGDRVVYFKRASKKKAGRLLDGRTWDEFPGDE